MAIKEVTLFSVECDGEKCNNVMEDGEGVALFRTKQEAIDILKQADFDAWDYTMTDDDKIYCSDCQEKQQKEGGETVDNKIG
jgi:hypothetical protein